jgi:hypothetical protein
MIATLPASTSSLDTTPFTPPKWSTWLCVWITAATGRPPRCFRYRASAAAAVSTEISESITMIPLLPSTRGAGVSGLTGEAG